MHQNHPKQLPPQQQLAALDNSGILASSGSHFASLLGANNNNNHKPLQFNEDFDNGLPDEPFFDDKSLSLNMAEEFARLGSDQSKQLLVEGLHPEGASAMMQQESQTKHGPNISQPRKVSRVNQHAKSDQEQQALKESAKFDLQSLNTILRQLQQLCGSQTNTQIASLVNVALKHQKGIQDTIENMDALQQTWKESFKKRVKKRLRVYKEQESAKLKQIEDSKFKQQINEYELCQRVSQLEQAYQHQQLEINKQANANEELKYQKVALIQQHSKRMAKIERALAKIQIQKPAAISQSEDKKNGRKATFQSFKANRTGNSVCGPEHTPGAPQSLLTQLVNKSAEEMSKSFCVGNARRLPQDVTAERTKPPVAQHRSTKSHTPPDEFLEINRQKSRGGDSLGTQLKNLQHLIKEFRENSCRQNSDEVGAATEEDNNSISDIDFNPDQKKTNNFLRKAEVKDENEETASVNKAIICQTSSANDKTDDNLSNFGSFCGEFAQQLNNTSFFGDNNQLPENLNMLFNRDEAPQDGKVSEKQDTKKIEDLLMETSNDCAVIAANDVSDLEVEEIFNETKSVRSFTREFKKEQKPSRNGKGTADVDLDDIMKASIATDFDAGLFVEGQKNNLQDFFEQNRAGNEPKDVDNLDLSSIDVKTHSNSNPLASADGKKSTPKIMFNDLSDIQHDVTDRNGELPIQQVVDQQIVLNCSNDSHNLMALNNNLMPNFEVRVKDKVIKIPKLDIERVVVLEDREDFKENLSAGETQSLITDLNLQSNMQSNASFQNESASKQFESKSKQVSQAQIDQEAQDVLNQCDQAISMIIDGKDLDKEASINIIDLSEIQTKENGVKIGSPALSKQVEQLNTNILDSLRSEIRNEDQSSKQGEFANNKNTMSPSDSMPFEFRQSGVHAGSSKMTDSDLRVSQITCKPVPKQLVTEQTSSVQDMKLDKKSQLMRLSELDSGSNHLHHASQNNEITRTMKMISVQGNELGDNNVALRNRAPSENQAKELNDEHISTMSPEQIINGNASASNGSLMAQSLGGNKSRLSAPITIPAKNSKFNHAQLAGKSLKDSIYATNAVPEADNEDSKILSLNNSNSKLNQSATEQKMFAYHSAAPRTTKSNKVAAIKTKKLETSQSSSSRALETTNIQTDKPSKSKQHKVSVSRVQRHADMSQLIKSQQKSSSSIQRLKIIKKSSVNSTAVPGSAGQNSATNHDGVSVDRTSIGVESSNISVADKSRHAGVSNFSRGDYAANESSMNRKSVETRKSKPITVCFKNIVKVNLQQTKNNASQQDDGNANVVNLQKILQKTQISNKLQDGEGRPSVVRTSKVKNSSQRTATADTSCLFGQNVKVQKVTADDSQQRDGSVVFIGKRRATIEATHNRGASQDISEIVQSKQSGAGDLRPKSKSAKGTKQQVAVDKLKKRKLSIGSKNDQRLRADSRESATTQEKKKRIVLSGSREHTQSSKPGTPTSPRRISAKLVKVEAQSSSIDHGIESNTSKVIRPSSVKKANVINIKRRDAVNIVNQTDANPNMSSSKGLPVKNQNAILVQGPGKRAPSVDSENPKKQNLNVSQVTRMTVCQETPTPNLKIKRMSKSKNTRGTSGNGQSKARNPIEVHNMSMNQSSLQSVTANTGLDQLQYATNESMLVKDMQCNQSTSILQDMSVLSRIGAADHKNQIIVVPSISAIGMVNQSQSQSSASNLILDQEASYVSSVNQNSYATDSRSSQVKKSGMGRASVEVSTNSATFKHSKPASTTQKQLQQKEQQLLQISTKAKKLIANQKQKNSGAQKQVLLEWKTPKDSDRQSAAGVTKQQPRHNNQHL